MVNKFSHEEMAEIASRLIIKTNYCFIFYSCMILFLLIFYILYKQNNCIKNYKKKISKLDSYYKELNKKIENKSTFMDDPMYMISRSQKGISNESLLGRENDNFENNTNNEDPRLLNALDDL